MCHEYWKRQCRHVPYALLPWWEGSHLAGVTRGSVSSPHWGLDPWPDHFYADTHSPTPLSSLQLFLQTTIGTLYTDAKMAAFKPSSS